MPAWLDGPTLRRWLPWTGTWRPGTGARVLPLRLADGREIPVLPLICLDDMDTGLAIDGARLGAQAILTMSNDSWFTDHPQGAELHQAAAAFRSIETRLPQFRVTTNGYSAVIDATGTVLAATRMGERTLVIGDVPVRDAAAHADGGLGRLGRPRGRGVPRAAGSDGGVAHVAHSRRGRDVGSGRRRRRSPPTSPCCRRLPASPPVLLRAFARGSLLWMGAAVLLGDGALQANTLAQIRTFAALFLAPEAAAWCVLRAFAARASIDQGALVLTRGTRRLELALRDIVAVEPWRVPLPGPGASLRLASGGRWRYGLAHADPTALARALAAAGGAPEPERTPSRATHLCACPPGHPARAP